MKLSAVAKIISKLLLFMFVEGVRWTRRAREKKVLLHNVQ